MPQALSLKYRPMKFSDLIGQDSVSQTLSLALDLNKVSHAYLFSGLRGSGKTSSARIFARALQCEKFPTSTPCGECASCQSAINNTNMDIIEMDAASSRSIDDVKDLIEQIQYRPAYSRFKIFIIDEVHMLTKEAFNALLKTLEEPPSYVKFILATTDPLKLPPTILSRTQHFRFKKIPQNVIATHLKRILGLEGVEFEDEAVDLLARNCGGSLRDALTLLEQAIIFSKENVSLQNVSSMLGALNPSVIEEYFAAILERDDEKIEALLGAFESYEVENIIDEMIIFLKNRVFGKDYKYNVVLVDRFFRILSEAKSMLAFNAEASFVLLLMTLKFRESLNIEELDKMIAKVEQEILQEGGILSVAHENSAKNAVRDSTNLTRESVNPPRESANLAPDSAKQPRESANVADLARDSTDSTPQISRDSVRDSVNPNAQDSAPNAQFTRLQDEISRLDFQIGEIFRKHYKFVDFKDDVLSWEGNAEGADKALLARYGKNIKAAVDKIFGAGIKINNISRTENPTHAADSTRIPQDSATNSASVADSTNGVDSVESARPNVIDSAQDSTIADSVVSANPNAQDSTHATPPSPQDSAPKPQNAEPEVIKDIEEIFGIVDKKVINAS